MKRLNAFLGEFKKQTAIAILAAFAFLIALSWRDFFSELVSHLIERFTLPGGLYIYKLINALIVTLIAVIGIMIISKLSTEKKTG